MPGPYIVGVDCGTQSAKVVIFESNGHVVAEGNQTLRPMDRPQQGTVLHPEDDIWDAISTASNRAMSVFPGDRNEIVAVGICPIRCCKAFLRADGSLIEPVMSWMDDRAYLPYLPNDPALAYATTLSGYIAHRFTGRFKDTAANNIEGQWPIDTDTWNWSANATDHEKHGLRKDLLFELQMPGEVIGPITATAAAATGLPAGVPAVATANDKAVEMLGAGVVDDRTALISLGTYIAAMVHGTTNHRSPSSFWTNFAAIPHRYLYESSGIRRGMWTLTWFLDVLGPEMAERAASLGVSREEYLEREASEVAAGSDGLMTVLDWLASAEMPFRKGTMIGFDARHTRGHVYRSILEAIALTMKINVDALCAEHPTDLSQLLISGGGSKSPLFMQIFADVFGLQTTRSIGANGASLGAAMCAASAVGLYPDIEAAVAAMASPRQSFVPNPANTALYQRINTVYPTIRAATDLVLERSYPMFH